MRNLAFLGVFLISISFGYSQEIVTDGYSVEKQTIQNLFKNSKYEQISIISNVSNLFLIAVWDYRENPIKYFVFDVNQMKIFEQPIPKGNYTIIKAKFSTSGDSILFHDTRGSGSYQVKQNIITK
jgi:hypothetical protein